MNQMAFEEIRNDTLPPDAPEQHSAETHVETVPEHAETPQETSARAEGSQEPEASVAQPATGNDSIHTSQEAPSAGAPKREEPKMTEDFATALETFEQEQTEAAQHEDRVIHGTVISVVPGKHLVVDIGTKNEGVVPIAEATDHAGNVKFNPGDPIDVMTEKGHSE